MAEKKEKSIESQLDAYKVLLHPLMTEKAVNMIDAENKLSFVVKKDSSKKIIKEAIENLYNVKVDSINVINDMKGRKKAIVMLGKEFKARDVASKIGVI